MKQLNIGWIAGLALSVALHGSGIVFLKKASKEKKNEPRLPIKVKIVEKPAQKKPEIVEKVEPPPPPKPKKEKKPPVATNKPKPAQVPKPVEAIQGFNKDKLLPGIGPGIAVPVGNTVMTEDKGRRVKDAEALTGDQSQDARLIPKSYTEPDYTDAAIDAGLEGRFSIDVFVNEKGIVIDAELRKKIGYGMDQKIIDAVKTARFQPRKNRLGIEESSWTNITITLRLP